MIDLSIIRLFLKRENYDKYGSIIYNIINNKNNNIEKEIINILLVINKYYNNYKEHKYLSVDELRTYFYTNYPSTVNNEIYSRLFDRLATLEVSDSLAADIVLQYLERESAAQVLSLVTPILSGDSPGLLLQIPEVIQDFKVKANLLDDEKSVFIEDKLDSLMDLVDKSHGLKWGLQCLNENLRPLPGGTLGHLFARVEKGKTTFISSQVSHFVKQLGDNERVLWICNEEHGRFVKLRTYQSILNLTAQEINQIIREGGRDMLERNYVENGGNKCLIRYDANTTVENIVSLLEKLGGVRVLIVDIADHVSFRGDGDYNTPQRLEELYRRYRQIAAHYGCDIITVGQASAECDGKKQVHEIDMYQSKTGKPGALDYAIGMGFSYDQNDSELRWLTLCKNKIGTTLKETSCVRIDAQRGQFYDI